jgi:hypothetical protein
MFVRGCLQTASEKNREQRSGMLLTEFTMARSEGTVRVDVKLKSSPSHQRKILELAVSNY